MPLHIQNVSKNYGDVPILKGLSFQLQKGEIVGFLGPNGAGKTTLMKILTGYLTQWDGAVQFDSFDLKKIPNRFNAFWAISLKIIRCMETCM